MILCGTLDSPGEVTVTLTADTSDFTRYIVETARRLTILDVTLEVLGLTADQTWSLFYVRGGMDPDFADEAARDNYLRCLLRLRGDRGRAAVQGFLAGWVTRHPDATVEPFVWHRFMAGTELRVSAA